MLDSMVAFDSAAVANWQTDQMERDYARRKYLHGIDLLVNKKKAEQSIPDLWESVRVAPTGEAYLALAQAFFDIEDIGMVHPAVRMALRYPEVRQRAAVLNFKGNNAILDPNFVELEQVVRDYQLDIDSLAADPWFKAYLDHEEFNILLRKYHVPEEQRHAMMMQMFLAHFDKKELPYAVGPDSLQEHNGRNIDFMYSALIPGLKDGRTEFSRTVAKSYEYVAEFPFSSTFHTLVIRSVNFYEGSYPIQYYTATIDTAGQFIDMVETGCFCTPMRVQTLSIDTDGLIKLETYRQQWQYAPEDSGYEHNSVIRRDLSGTEFLRITEQGRIIAAAGKPL